MLNIFADALMLATQMRPMPRDPSGVRALWHADLPEASQDHARRPKAQRPLDI